MEMGGYRSSASSETYCAFTYRDKNFVAIFLSLRFIFVFLDELYVFEFEFRHVHMTTAILRNDSICQDWPSH